MIRILDTVGYSDPLGARVPLRNTARELTSFELVSVPGGL
jgi:hypothetical protein